MSLNDLSPRQRQQNAAKLSAWLYVHEPDLFRQLLVQLPRLQRTPLGRLGFFGDDTGITDTVTVTAPDASGATIIDTSAPAVDLTSFSPELSSVGVDTSLTTPVADPVSAAVAAPASVDSSVADSSGSAAGFWSSLGSGLGSAASAVGKVAGALVSPQSIAAAGTAATAYFNSQARTAQTQAQQAATQVQLARLAQGATPAAVTYARNPYTGALTPTYLGNAGAQPLTGSLLNRLSAPGSLTGGLSPLVLLGGGALLLVLLVGATRSS